MTGITPLETIHKKGIFGEHHKKNESDLLKISEIKELNIIQVFQYKKSEVKIGSKSIDGIKFPEESPNVNSNDKTRVLWNGPRTWLVISKKENILEIIGKEFNPKDFAITDISHSRAAVQLEGIGASEVIKKPDFDFDPIEKYGGVGSGINLNQDYLVVLQHPVTNEYFD